MTEIFHCIECPMETFQAREDLEAHVAGSHFNYLPYECEQIRYQVSPDLLQKRNEIDNFMARCLSNDDADPNSSLHTSIAFSIDALFNGKDQDHDREDGNQDTGQLFNLLKRRNIPDPVVVSVKKPKEDGQGSSSKHKETATCQACRRVVANQSTSMMYHTNFSHLKLPVFTCIPCNRVWTAVSKGDTLKHIRKYHQGDESVIIDRKKEFIEEIRKKCDELFPNRPKRIIRIDEGGEDEDEESVQAKVETLSDCSGEMGKDI
ncbi:hypothetical protein FO519_005886 [Halicephalobus sp. NKZ332]|nr:hypothetical protein FO519_005886 [Halicephalobus sp. NKZ332]